MVRHSSSLLQGAFPVAKPEAHVLSICGFGVGAPWGTWLGPFIAMFCWNYSVHLLRTEPILAKTPQLAEFREEALGAEQIWFSRLREKKEAPHSLLVLRADFFLYS